MFSRNKKSAEPKRKHDLSQFGLFDVPTDIGVDGMDDDDDDASDLEAELAAIASGGGRARQKPKAKPKVDTNELDRMVAESLRDIPSDEELSGDDDDPDLLNELSTIAGIELDESPVAEEAPTPTTPLVTSPPTSPKKEETFVPTTTTNTADLLKQRIQMYKDAEENAKLANETSRAKRFNRGLKTLESMLKQVTAGRPIDPEEIPPEVFVKSTTKTDNNSGGDAALPAADIPVRVAPPPPVASSETIAAAVVPESADPVIPTSPAANDNEEKINVLFAAQKEYKLAALTAKKNGDKAAALQYIKIVKVFDQVLTAARAGEAVDLSDMPPPPSQMSLDSLIPQPPVAAADPPPAPSKEEAEVQKSQDAPAAGLITATNVLEALQQRMEVFKAAIQSAKEQGNSSKARRSERIVKQFEDAIKQYKAGRPVAYEELPTPPGYGPIPVATAAGATPSPTPPRPAPVPPSPSSPPAASKPSPEKSPSRPTLQKQESRVSGNHTATTLMNKNIETLLERQKEFKEAALAAKKAGEIEQAKEYLKIYKGFDSMLDAARGGLPVDLATLPISPSQRQSLENTFDTVSDNDDGVHDNDDLHDVIGRLEEQLQKQLTMCKTTRDHHKALGDVAGTNRFENLALSVQKDLDIVKLARRKKGVVPKFHYEQKQFNILKCNTDLAETELEINVVRGIGYHVSNPKNVDTYVKVEFPYPQETPYRTKTQVIYDSDSPEYNEKFIVEIQPKQRLCQRAFKRHAIKCEVYTKGGFFRTDPLIGTVTVKLQPLETGVEIHDSFELMDGRKSAGGKLEVKVRVRNPIVSKQMESISEKWIVIET